ncbi:uncharacterized protein LOC121005379 [Bufo bufo]|uniref:uncharacterized protein LOC121005379 n=1 Tax=Bufo bufo TaxID=8384 RepID=UPI001ABE411E|nr:uncharacterized protein LOC121005379 [Bufo bufo]XP_040294024.1 uncharacterized protein LOC121005379 [Bufo bufo]
MPVCIVNGCPSGGRQKEHGVIVHVFPKDKNMIRAWLIQTGQDFGDLEQFVNKVYEGKKTDSYRLCSKHFAPECYTHLDGWRKLLRKDAIPTIFYHPDFPPSSLGPNGKIPARKRRKVDRDAHLGPLGFCDHCGQQSIRLPKVVSVGVNTESVIVRWDRSTNTDPKLNTRAVAVEHKIKTYRKKTQCNFPFNKNKTKLKASDGSKIPHASSGSSAKVHAQGGNVAPPHGSLPMNRTPKVLPSLLVEKGVSVQNVIAERTPAFGTQSCSSQNDLRPTLHASNVESSRVDEINEAHHKKYNPKQGIGLNRNSMSERKFIVSESCLDALITMVSCKGPGPCGKPIVKIFKKRVGTFVSVYVTCADNHRTHLWESQPKEANIPVGNLALSASVLFSGSTFRQVHNLFYLMGLECIRKSTYHKYQKKYLFPTVRHHWKKDQAKSLSVLGNSPVCIVGDGQSDGLGRNTRYSLYTLMDACTKKILNFRVEQMRPGLLSARLEKEAFQKSLEKLQKKKVHIKIICTDKCAGIRKMIKTDYSPMVHQLDVWHVAKSIGAKVLSASKRKSCGDLSAWVSAVRDHLWWSASTCDNNAELLLEKWNSLLNHTANEHTWSGNKLYHQCEHNSVEQHRWRRWLPWGSAAHNSLREIVLNPSLQDDLKHLFTFCHPTDIELFHSAISKYRPKRGDFVKDSVKARIRLASLHHNFNINRVQHEVRKTTIRSATQKRLAVCSKDRKHQFLCAVYEPSNQRFLLEIMKDVLELADGKQKL